VTSHPFEVSDEGWGEFEAGMLVELWDPTLCPIRFTHHLRLHPLPGQASSMPPDAPVVSEFYDEVVFNNPETQSPELMERIAKFMEPSEVPSGHRLEQHFKEFSPAGDLAQIAAAQAFVAQETARLMERLARADTEATQIMDDLETLGWSTGRPFSQKDASVGNG
jgi:transcription initiation factor IIF auxiliary subunit